MKTIRNLSLIAIIFIIAILINTNVYAAGIGMSINKSSAYVGDSFSITISGINGKVKISGNSNISLSTSGTQWVEGSMTITGTTKSEGTGTITVTPIDASTTGADPVEVTTGASKNIKITKKQEQTPQQPQTPPTTTTNKTSNKDNNKKDKEKVTETKEKEEATPELGIHSLKLIGVKENAEEVEIALDKEFNIKTFDYLCNVENDVKTLKIEKEAYEYNDIVQISGLDEELKVGENIITLKLSNKGKDVTYTIKVTKQEKQETNETKLISAEPEERKEMIVSIPLVWFILLELAIVVVSVTVTILVLKYLKTNRYNDNEY